MLAPWKDHISFGATAGSASEALKRWRSTSTASSFTSLLPELRIETDTSATFGNSSYTSTTSVLPDQPRNSCRLVRCVFLSFPAVREALRSADAQRQTPQPANPFQQRSPGRRNRSQRHPAKVFGRRSPDWQQRIRSARLRIRPQEYPPAPHSQLRSLEPAIPAPLRAERSPLLVFRIRSQIAAVQPSRAASSRSAGRPQLCWFAAERQDHGRPPVTKRSKKLYFVT